MRKLLLFFAMLSVSIGAWATITITTETTPYSGYGIYGAKAGEIAKLLNGDNEVSVKWNGVSLADLTSAEFVKIGSSSQPNVLNNDDLEALELLSGAKFLDIDGSTLASGANITSIKAGSAIEAVTLPNNLKKAQVNAAGAALTACNANFGSCLSLNAEMEERQINIYTYEDPCTSEKVDYNGEVTDGQGYIGDITRPLTFTGSSFTYINTKFKTDSEPDGELSTCSEDQVVNGYVVPNPLKVKLTTRTVFSYGGNTYDPLDSSDNWWYNTETGVVTNGYNSHGIPEGTEMSVSYIYSYTFREGHNEVAHDYNGTPLGDAENGFYAMIENNYTGDGGDGYQFEVTSTYNYTYTDENCVVATKSYGSPQETIDVTYNTWVDIETTTITVNVPKEGGDCDAIAYVNTPGTLYKATKLDENDVVSVTGIVISGNITLGDIAASQNGADPMPSAGESFNPPVTPTKYTTTTENPAWYFNNGINYKSLDLLDARIDNPEYLRVVSTNMAMERIVFPSNLTSIPVACCYANGNSGNCNLKEAVMPDGLRQIGDYAFHGTAIEDVFIRNTTDYVGYKAFATSKVQNVTFEKGLTDLSFSGYVFDSCMDLKHVVLPEGVLNIGNYIFNMCKNLDAIRLPSTLVTLGDGAFHECTSLRSLTIPEGVRRIGKQALSLCYIEDLYLMSQSIDELPAIFSAGSDGTNANSSFASNQLYANGSAPAEGPQNIARYKTLTSEEMLQEYRNLGSGGGNTLTYLHYNEALKDFIDYNPFYYASGAIQANEDPYISNTYLYVDKEGKTWPAAGNNIYGSSGREGQRGDGEYAGDYARCLEAGDPTAEINAGSPYATTSLDEPSKLGWRQFVLKTGVSPESHEVLVKEYKDIWYTMCFPWHLTDEQLESAFASNFCIAEFTGVKVTEDDGQYTLQLCFDEVAKAKPITDSSYPSMNYSEDGETDPGYLAVAGHPYMIHPATGTLADEPAVRCYLTDLHPLDYSLETNAPYTAQAQKVQKKAMILKNGSWEEFTDGNGNNAVYTFIGNTSNDPTASVAQVGDYTLYNAGTEEEPNYYKYVPENAYFLAVKKSESNYPRYFREVRTEAKREAGNKAGKWSLYSAVVYPDDNALSSGGLEKLLDGNTASAKGFNIEMFDFEGLSDVSEATAVEKIVNEAKANNVPVQYMNVVFSINGQVVSKDSKDLQNLPKGVYIVNGKKYFVK